MGKTVCQSEGGVDSPIGQELKFFKRGGEVDEMDVSPCNPLFDLRLDAQVLSKTLNCSARVEMKF
jgi:hypothetical protein